MDCVVEADLYYEDGPEFFTQKIVRANKEYKCTECKSIIKKGDMYERSSGKWNGDLSTYKTCSVCHEVREKLMCSYYFEMLWEHLTEHFRENELTLGCIEGLSKDAVLKIEEQFYKYIWEDDEDE